MTQACGRAAMIVAGLILSLSSARGADPVTLTQVLTCMRTNLPPSLSVQQIELTATDRDGGIRLLRGRLLGTREPGSGLTRTVLRIEAPKNLAGASYLIRQAADTVNDEMYVFLPSVKRVRKITGTLANGALLGTNFSYDDFRQLATAFVGAAATLESSSAELDGKPVDVLSFVPEPATHSAYDSIRTWVDASACVPVKAEFYEATRLRKRLLAPPGALLHAGSYAYVSQFEMRDLSDGTTTVLRTLDVSGDARISPRAFDPRTFYREP